MWKKDRIKDAGKGEEPAGKDQKPDENRGGGNSSGSEDPKLGTAAEISVDSKKPKA